MSGVRRSPRRRAHAETAAQRAGSAQADDSFTAHIERVAPAREKRTAHHDADTHRPNKALREEVVDDLVFIRESSQPGPSRAPARAAPVPVASRPTRPTRPPVARRNSINVKGLRRMSSLRDGTPAYPHIDVPDQALYRHLSDQAPPVVRMKHLLNWTLHRSIPQALGEAPMPRLGKASAHNAELALLHAIPPHAARALTEQEKQKLAETAPLLRKVIDDTLRDLNDGLIGISWLNQSKDHEPRSLQPHPRNQSNAHAAQQLEGMQQQLHAELAAWEAQEECLQRIQVEAERYTQLAAEVREQSAKDKGRASAMGDDADEDDAIAAEIDAALASHAAEDAEHGVLWTAADLDEATRAHLALADEVLQAAHELNAAAVAKRDQEPGSDIPGTETDAHLRTLELRADEIEMRLHAVGQLDALAAKYLGQVATRASQALQERTSAGLASFAAPQGEEDATEPSEQQRLDALLAGVRAPSEGAPPEPAVPHADARELLRALARPQ